MRGLACAPRADEHPLPHGREYFALGGKSVRMSGFKNFIMRGNLVELAVAVVIGTQFSSLVKQFVSSFVNPLLSLVGGTPDFGNLTFKVGQGHLQLRPVRHRGLVLPDLRPGGLLHPGPAGQPPAPAARAEQGRDHQGLPRVHDEHPGRRPALPGVHDEITPATEQPQPVGSRAC